MNTSRTRTFAVLGLTTLIGLSPVLQAQGLPTIPTLEVIRRIDVNVAPRVEQPVLTTPVPVKGEAFENRVEANRPDRTDQPATMTPEAVKDEAFENRVDANRPDRTEQPATNPATGSDFENRVDGNASTSEPKPNDTTNTAAQSTSTNTPSNTVTAPTTSNETVPTPANTSVLSYPTAQQYLDELERKRNQQDRYAAEDTANAALDSREPHLPLYSAAVVSDLRMAETALQALLVQQLSATIARAPMQGAGVAPAQTGTTNLYSPVIGGSAFLGGLPDGVYFQCANDEPPACPHCAYWWRKAREDEKKKKKEPKFTPDPLGTPAALVGVGPEPVYDRGRGTCGYNPRTGQVTWFFLDDDIWNRVEGINPAFRLALQAHIQLMLEGQAGASDPWTILARMWAMDPETAKFAGIRGIGPGIFILDLQNLLNGKPFVNTLSSSPPEMTGGKALIKAAVPELQDMIKAEQEKEK